MVEDAAEAVLRCVAFHARFHGFADGDAEATGAVWVFSQNLLPRICAVAWARVDVRAVELHHHPAVGLLVVAYADHVDLDVDVEE